MFTSDNYLMVFIATAFIWLAVEVWLIIRDRKVKAEGSTFNGKIAYMLLIAVVIVALILHWFTEFDLPVSTEIRLLIGTVIVWFGLLLRWSAIYTLGRYFNVIVRTQPSQKVVKTGPYKYMRHPSYTGSMLVYFGLGFGLGNAIGLVLMLMLPFLIFYLRAAVEERILISSFGESYKDYMRYTSRFFFMPGKYNLKKDDCRTPANN